MNFEKIELYGFKSFADKAEIKFGNGITAIVGPNGCGKSNVADAIRWVLGEQSAKTLRGSSMQDVIFAGTQDRKLLSYCEVSLYFDNTNRMFSIDYNEVIITRKLFRSGESEYYINKQPARLKDIVDLLHECGIGKEGYSIIGQGKVEEIMSAKPEDRRMIFEEATGIAKNKALKLETERKLERTHENYVRYADMASVIEEQLGPMAKQAEKAKEFNELSAELKRHELNVYVAKVEGVETAKNKIYTKIKGIDEQTELRNTELVKAQKEYDEIFSDIEKADGELKSYNSEFLEKRVNMERSSGARTLFNERISYLNGQIERAEKEQEENKTLIEQSLQTIGTSEQTLKENDEKLTELRNKEKTTADRLKVVSEKIIVGEELASANQQKVIESIENLSTVKLNKGTMDIKKDNLIEKKDELTAKLDDYSVKREKLFNDKERCDKTIEGLEKGITEVKQNIENKENEIRAINEDSSKLDNEINSLTSVTSALNTRVSFYQNMKDNYEGYNPSVKNLMTSAKDNPQVKSRIRGVVAELVKNDKKYDVALEMALMAAAQNVVTKTTDDAKYLIEYLRDNKLGRVTFLPENSVKPRELTPQLISSLNEKGALGIGNQIVQFDAEYDNVFSNLLGNTLFVDNLDNAKNIAEKYNFAFKIVTLDGDVFATQGSISGGYKKQESLSFMSVERKIEEYAKSLSEKTAEMDKLKEKRKANDDKWDKANDELTLLNEMYNSKRQQLVLENEKQTSIENSLSEIGKEIEGVSDIIATLNERLQKIDSDYKAVASGGVKLEEARENAKMDAEKQQAEYDELKKERETLLSENTDIQIKITALNGENDSIRDEIARLKGVIKDCGDNIERLKNSNENAAGIIEKLRLEQEKVALTKEEQDEINAIRAKIESIESSKLKLKEKLDVNDQKKNKLTEELAELTEKKNQEKIELAKIDSDLEHMGESVFKDYQETYETAVKVKEENYDVKFGEQEISRIRKRRSSLGQINAEAVDQYKELTEKYEEMQKQMQDIEAAENDLKKAIETIKGEMLSTFDEGFNKINENFKKIFKELFGGGRAMLELDYSEGVDKLDAGIEIIAEPPGKKLQKLSLLSGGEKALTAIAILFSILKMRPMPFCVLDEIEAALDEANVDRFARYLKKFSEETQFIVITHRKPTMELADALFGVTMQEKGISKMVSVKLSDVAAFDETAS